MGYTKGRFITLLISGKYSLSLGISTNQHDPCYYCYNLNKAMDTYITFTSSKTKAVLMYLWNVHLQNKCHGNNVANSFLTNILQQYSCVLQQ